MQFEYTIKDYNKENSFVTVQVYCELFKQPKEKYPHYNIGIQDIPSKEVFQEALEEKCGLLVNQILLEENQERVEEISKFVTENKFKTQFVADENKPTKKINIKKQKTLRGKTFELVV